MVSWHPQCKLTWTIALECSSVSDKEGKRVWERSMWIVEWNRHGTRALRAASRSASHSFAAVGLSSRDTWRTRRHEIIMVIEQHRSWSRHEPPTFFFLLRSQCVRSKRYHAQTYNIIGSWSANKDYIQESTIVSIIKRF